MRAQLIAAVILIAVLATPAAAQDDDGGGGGGGGGRGGGGGGAGGNIASTTPREATPIEQFVGRLRLDVRAQGPAVEQILQAAARDAAPVAQEILQHRQNLVNLMLRQGADTKPALDALTAASARMVAIETNAFREIYALLRPNQQNNAVSAFAILAGFFQAPAPSGRGGGRGRGGD